MFHMDYVGIERDIYKIDLIDRALTLVQDDSNAVDDMYKKYDTIVYMLDVNDIILPGHEGVISAIGNMGKASIKKAGELVKKLIDKAIEIFKGLYLKLKVLAVKISGYLDGLFKDIDGLSTEGMVEGKVEKGVAIHDKLNSIMGKYKEVTAGDDNGNYIDKLLLKLNGKSPLFEAHGHLKKLNSDYIKFVVKEEKQVQLSMSKYTSEAKKTASLIKGGVKDKSFITDIKERAEKGVALVLIDPYKIKLMSFSFGKVFKSHTKDLKLTKPDEFVLNISKSKTKNWITSLQSAKKNFPAKEAGDHVVTGYKDAVDVLNNIKKNKKSKPDLVKKAIAVNKYFTSIMYEELKTNTRAYKAIYEFIELVSDFDSEDKEKEE